MRLVVLFGMALSLDFLIPKRRTENIENDDAHTRIAPKRTGQRESPLGTLRKIRGKENRVDW